MTRARKSGNQLARLRAEWIATALEPDTPERAVVLAAIERAARAVKLLRPHPPYTPTTEGSNT